MNLKDSRQHYYDHTGKASDVQRQLAIAGIAIIWVFRIETGIGQKIPEVLTLSLIMFVSAIASDLLQYLLAGILWGVYSRHKEKSIHDEEKEFLAPRWINWPGNTFFALKFILVIYGYYKLLVYLTIKLIQ